jgi:hypothetical protein
MITTQSMRYRVNGSRYPDRPGHGPAWRTLDFNAINANTRALRALPAETVSRPLRTMPGGNYAVRAKSSGRLHRTDHCRSAAVYLPDQLLRSGQRDV